MSEIRDGGRNVRDRQAVVGQDEARNRRDETRTRQARTAGYRAQSDLANAEATLRQEIEAADALALQAALDAEDALFEAQFGSIAVGRLQAGTINVAIELNSPVINGGTISGTTGTFSGTLSGGSITGSSISIGLSGDTFNVNTNGRVWSNRYYRTSSGSNSYGFEFTSATGWYADVLAPGGLAINGQFVATTGSRTTQNANWSGGAPTGSDSTSLAIDSNTGATLSGTTGGSITQHRHTVPQHTHTVFI